MWCIKLHLIEVNQVCLLSNFGDCLLLKGYRSYVSQGREDGSEVGVCNGIGVDVIVGVGVNVGGFDINEYILLVGVLDSVNATTEGGGHLVVCCG